MNVEETLEALLGKDKRLSGLIDQTKKLKQLYQSNQEAAAAKKHEVSVGGGMVKIIMNGRKELDSISIETALIDPAKTEMLQDLVLSAFNEGIRRVKAEAEDTMRKTISENMPSDISKFFES